MRVGISGSRSCRDLGRSETYVRELVRALGRVGRHEYRLLLPSIAADVDGLPAEVVDEYRASRSTAGAAGSDGERMVPRPPDARRDWTVSTSCTSR